MTRNRFRAGLLLILVLAAWLRLPDLDQRPLHTDEAIHGYRFGQLLEDGEYRYDTVDYHGPTLNYFTLLPAWLGGAERITEVSDATLRLVPAFFGLAIVALVALLSEGLGRGAVLAAAALTAVSPAMVYYSRYYIQETLLVAFGLGALAAGYRYVTRPGRGWALTCGASLGLMHASKETAVLTVGAAGVALLVMSQLQGGGLRAMGQRVEARHLALALGAAAAVSALLYSSFGAHPVGIVDSYRSLGGYVTKAGAEGPHVHPWHYYLGLAGLGGGVVAGVWSEVSILVLAVVGAVAAFRGGASPRVGAGLAPFLAVYSLVLWAGYSAIPYKTPWSMLGALHGTILLAGVGAATAWRVAASRARRFAVAGLLAAALVFLGYQAHDISRAGALEARNPYLYSQPTDDVRHIADRVEAIAARHPQGNAMRVDVIAPGGDYWPLPWYLRGLPNVGYWSEVPTRLPPAPVIVASPEVEDSLLKLLYEAPPPGQRSLYVPLFHEHRELRPGVEFRGYVVASLWSRYQSGLGDPGSTRQAMPADREEGR